MTVLTAKLTTRIMAIIYPQHPPRMFANMQDLSSQIAEFRQYKRTESEILRVVDLAAWAVSNNYMLPVLEV